MYYNTGGMIGPVNPALSVEANGRRGMLKDGTWNDANDAT